MATEQGGSSIQRELEINDAESVKSLLLAIQQGAASLRKIDLLVRPRKKQPSDKAALESLALEFTRALLACVESDTLRVLRIEYLRVPVAAALITLLAAFIESRASLELFELHISPDLTLRVLPGESLSIGDEFGKTTRENCEQAERFLLSFDRFREFAIVLGGSGADKASSATQSAVWRIAQQLLARGKSPSAVRFRGSLQLQRYSNETYDLEAHFENGPLVFRGLSYQVLALSHREASAQAYAQLEPEIAAVLQPGEQKYPKQIVLALGRPSLQALSLDYYERRLDVTCRRRTPQSVEIVSLFYRLL